jgi:hypothetical protein
MIGREHGHIQRALLLKLKESSGLLKRERESSKEFNNCLVIGGTHDSGAAAASCY